MKASHSEAVRRPVRIQVAHHTGPKGAVVSVDEDNLTRAGAEQHDRLRWRDEGPVRWVVINFAEVSTPDDADRKHPATNGGLRGSLGRGPAPR